VIRILLLAILFLVIAQLFWRLVEGIVQGATGTESKRKRTIQPSMKLVRDPVCGTYVAPRRELSVTASGKTHYFCSEKCRRAFRG
jgi:YHS domain-containing protein